MPHSTLRRRVFIASLWGKALDGALEIAGGLILLLVTPATLSRLAIVLTQHELVEDPQDLVASALRQAASQLSASTQLFGGIYLIAHGLIKIGIVAAVLSGRRRAYPVAIGFLVLFIIYQLYRLSYHYSIGLLLLTLFDMLIVWLIWREYKLAGKVEPAQSSG